MSSYYVWFNRKELPKKAYDKYHCGGGKEKQLNTIKKQRGDQKKRKRQIQIYE